MKLEVLLELLLLRLLLLIHVPCALGPLSNKSRPTSASRRTAALPCANIKSLPRQDPDPCASLGQSFEGFSKHPLR